MAIKIFKRLKDNIHILYVTEEWNWFRFFQTSPNITLNCNTFVRHSDVLNHFHFRIVKENILSRDAIRQKLSFQNLEIKHFLSTEKHRIEENYTGWTRKEKMSCYSARSLYQIFIKRLSLKLPIETFLLERNVTTNFTFPFKF